MSSPEINQCDLRCPDLTILAVSNRVTITEASPLGEAVRHTLDEFRSFRAVGRAVLTCGSRKLDEETWRSSGTCSKRAQKVANQLGAISANDLTEREQNNLYAANIDVE